MSEFDSVYISDCSGLYVSYNLLRVSSTSDELTSSCEFITVIWKSSWPFDEYSSAIVTATLLQVRSEEKEGTDEGDGLSTSCQAAAEPLSLNSILNSVIAPPPV